MSDQIVPWTIFGAVLLLGVVFGLCAGWTLIHAVQYIIWVWRHPL